MLSATFSVETLIQWRYYVPHLRHKFSVMMAQVDIMMLRMLARLAATEVYVHSRDANSVLNTIVSKEEAKVEVELSLLVVAEAGGPVSTALKDSESRRAEMTPIVVASVTYASFAFFHPPTRPYVDHLMRASFGLVSV